MERPMTALAIFGLRWGFVRLRLLNWSFYERWADWIYWRRLHVLLLTGEERCSGRGGGHVIVLTAMWLRGRIGGGESERKFTYLASSPHWEEQAAANTECIGEPHGNERFGSRSSELGFSDLARGTLLYKMGKSAGSPGQSWSKFGV
ncbi:hypothetical protein NDU88_003594 [Pleurodeles waltl]|uniref:Uncharacterized protein n=1 Tax=Pleurodeles waltl TaxID=8319 RepID=A0AAV7VFT7_PLEWA|nr:hypothetical protein NDU88_003594 [Pleurodeles waltl]